MTTIQMIVNGAWVSVLFHTAECSSGPLRLNFPEEPSDPEPHIRRFNPLSPNYVGSTESEVRKADRQWVDDM